MRAFITIVVTALLACFPRLAISQASINNGVNISAYYPVYQWLDYDVLTPDTYWTMNNFDIGKYYKIVIEQDAPNIVQDLEMKLVHFSDQANQYLTLYPDIEFEWIAQDYGFAIHYTIPKTAPYNQTQLLKFQIYKKVLGIWDWQTSFFYYLNTSCPGSYVLNSTLGANDYEVGNNLTVSGSAMPSSGICELDGGSSVTLLPGFRTVVNNNSGVLVINDGCGGAYRTMSPATALQEPANKGVFSSAGIKVYPNPAKNLLQVSLPEADRNDELSFELRDVNGRLLRSEKKWYRSLNSINLEGLDAGLYFISINGDNLHHVQKIIKE